MKKLKFIVIKIVKALKESDSGRTVGDLKRKLCINPQSFYNWKKKYFGMNGEHLKHLKEL